MDQGSGRSWRGMFAEAIASRIAGGREHPHGNGPDFNHAGRGWLVKILDHAERHKRALVAIHGHGLVRAARHVGGHLCRRHFRHRSTHSHARIRRPGKRSEHEPCDRKDRQQPGKVERYFHARILPRSSRQGNPSRITNSPILVIPGRATWREPGIHWAASSVDEWIPGSCFARPGMTLPSVRRITFR